MFGVLSLTPAYGRVYKTEAQVRLAFLVEGKDFQTPSGSYTSARELKELGFKEASVRYGKNLEYKAVIQLEERT